MRAENINFIMHMAAILDLCKLCSLPYIGFYQTFYVLFEGYIWNVWQWNKFCCNLWWVILFLHWTICSTAFYTLRESLIHAPILAFPTETGQYILDTDASNFGLGGVLGQIQDDVERVVAYCSRALRNAGCCGHVHPKSGRICVAPNSLFARITSH